MDLDKIIVTIHKKHLALDQVNRTMKDRPSKERDRLKGEIKNLDKKLKEELLR